MAVSKAFFGLRTGSTKSHTYQVYRGLQVTKDRVTTVANPQTNLQMLQRLKLVLVANAAAILKGLINHSFQGVEYGYKSIAEFRKRNLSKGLANIASFAPKGYSGLGLADFIVSNGSLPSKTLLYAPAEEGDGGDPERLTLSGAVSTAVNNINTTSAEAIATSLGITVGDQITFLIALQHKTEEIDVTLADGTVKKSKPIYYEIARIVTDPEDENYMNGVTYDKSGVLFMKDAALEWWPESGFLTQQRDVETGETVEGTIEGLGPAANYQIVGGCAIVSRKVDGVWQRSPQSIQTYSTLDDAWTFEEAEPTYLKSTASSAKYLNQGDSVTYIGGNTYTY